MTTPEALAEAIRLQAERLLALAGHMTSPPVSELAGDRLAILAAPTLVAVAALEKEVVVLIGFAKGLSKVSR